MGGIVPDAEDVDRNVEPDVNKTDLTSSLVHARKAYSARRYDYWLGGKDNFAADRRSGDEVEVVFPTIRLSTIENRRFLRRAVGFLMGAGIRQFLDIGSGMPTDSNTHEVAQAIAPQSRVVYVDNDPIVVSHARALLVSSPEGHIDYVEGDLRAPQDILRSPGLRATLDMEQPIGLMLLALLHFFHDADDPYGLVGQLVAAMPPGSYLVMSHGTYDPLPAEAISRLEEVNAVTEVRWRARSRDEFARFFAGLQLVDPGIVSIGDWHPTPGSIPPAAEDLVTYGAVARIG
jgi:S-adenosyl methyltransferase